MSRRSIEERGSSFYQKLMRGARSLRHKVANHVFQDTEVGETVEFPSESTSNREFLQYHHLYTLNDNCRILGAFHRREKCRHEARKLRSEGKRDSESKGGRGASGQTASSVAGAGAKTTGSSAMSGPCYDSSHGQIAGDKGIVGSPCAVCESPRRREGGGSLKGAVAGRDGLSSDPAEAADQLLTMQEPGLASDEGNARSVAQVSSSEWFLKVTSQGLSGRTPLTPTSAEAPGQRFGSNPRAEVLQTRSGTETDTRDVIPTNAGSLEMLRDATPEVSRGSTSNTSSSGGTRYSGRDAQAVSPGRMIED